MSQEKKAFFPWATVAGEVLGAGTGAAYELGKGTREVMPVVHAAAIPGVIGGIGGGIIDLMRYRNEKRKMLNKLKERGISNIVTKAIAEQHPEPSTMDVALRTAVLGPSAGLTSTFASLDDKKREEMLQLMHKPVRTPAEETYLKHLVSGDTELQEHVMPKSAAFDLGRSLANPHLCKEAGVKTTAKNSGHWLRFHGFTDDVQQAFNEHWGLKPGGVGLTEHRKFHPADQVEASANYGKGVLGQDKAASAVSKDEADEAELDATIKEISTLTRRRKKPKLVEKQAEYPRRFLVPPAMIAGGVGTGAILGALATSNTPFQTAGAVAGGGIGGIGGVLASWLILDALRRKDINKLRKLRLQEGSLKPNDLINMDNAADILVG